ncbi:MAG TPA: glycosyl hydrolase family 28-related protein [Terriglobia bacterium]|nr:glycosyl hydrolase family 28-related protein [Terriglobia bacterium]
MAKWGLKGLPLLATHYSLLAVFLTLLATGYSPIAAFAQAKTTVADTIHAPDGSLPSGRIVIKADSTFTAADGTVVFQGTVATATVTNGALSVALVPTAGSTPAGASYQALYELSGVPYHSENWTVPASGPVTLSGVRSASLSTPTTMVASSQMPALSGAVTSSPGSTVTTFSAGAITTGITDKGGQLFNVKAYGAKGDGSTDDTAAVNAAFAAAYAARGGVIYFPPGIYLIAGALTVPNDGASSPKQPPYRIEGASMDGNSASWGLAPSNGSILMMTETSDAQGKIDTRGGGYMEIDHVSFQDSASDSVPFIFTTNTTLHVHDCSFTSSQTGTANVQDAIILGGPNPADLGTGNADAPFQGYGTVIRDDYFNRVRHAVVGNTYANGIQIVDNTVGQGSGSATAGDAPFKFVGYGAGAQNDSGGYISGNLIEETYYSYGVRLDQNAESFTMLGNNGYDAGAHTVATYYLGAGSDTEVMSCGQVAGTCIDTSSPGAAGQNYVAFTTNVDSSGNGSYLGNMPMFPKGFTVRSGETINLQTLVGQQTEIYEQSYSTYIQPNDGGAYDSIITHNGLWGILNTSPQAAFDVKGDIRSEPVTFASAPACSSTIEGSMQAIRDSTTATWGAAITGGGTNHVLGYCDGTNWTVAGK